MRSVDDDYNDLGYGKALDEDWTMECQRVKR
jgi:hypothetical protein